MRGLILLLAALMASAPGARAQILLPDLGGPGGGRFSAPCPAGQNLVGVEVRAADDVDAVRPVCAPAQGPQQAGPATAMAAWHGGDGGSFLSLICPPSTPVVLSIDVAWEGEDTKVVNALELYCGRVSATTQRLADYPNASFAGPHYKPSPAFGPFGVRGYDYAGDRETCPAGQVAVGVHGRSGVWLDAIGLICDGPRLSSIGRVNRGSPAPNRSLCEAASDARARNSPMAAALTAQCQAFQATQPPPVRSIGRLNRGSPASSGSLCDAATAAQARNSPVAAHLEDQCQAAGGRPAPPDPAPIDDPPAEEPRL